MRTSLDLLLVEDNEGDVEMTRRALRTATPACRMAVANNGQQALDLLRKVGRYGEAVTPQLILLDINMPGMDGKQFLDHVKKDDNLKAIPVVMFTSSESMKDVNDCFDRHASAYVVKPFDGAQYGEAVREVVYFWGAVSELP